MAGVALGDIQCPLAWQAWHSATWTWNSAWQAWHLWRWAGSRGGLGSRLSAVDAAAVCVASVALGDINFHSAWQAWRLATSVAGVALMALGWLWWCAWFPFVAVDAGAVCVAGVWHLEASTSILCG